MALTLTVLGCCGTYAAPDGACSGYLVQGGGTTVWLDAGPGTLANLQRHVGFHAVDAVVLSHEHPDHWSDVMIFRNVARYVAEREGIPVFAPAGIRERMVDESGPTFDWQEVADGEQLDVGDLRLRFSRTDHPVETLAVRVDGDGASLAYSADTGPQWSFARLGDEVDLAVCEATLTAGQEGLVQHLSARQAAAAAQAGGARRLLLTHLLPGLDPEQSQRDAAAAFDGPVEVARHHARYAA